MGTVWAALDLNEQRDVALKIVKDEGRADRRRRFSREARAAMSLDHPNVVRIYEVSDGDPPFMVLDLLRGEPLLARVARERPFSLETFANIFVPVFSAVGTAHASGIVHRDLKPGNIFLVDGDDPRVLDFGIAKFAEQDLAVASTNLTSTGDILGTPQYMSPEQIFGESDLDHRSDIWSLGIIAFECLAGRHPIAGENVGQVIKAITTSVLPTLPPEQPPEVRAMVSRMMTRERARRPADLREVLRLFRLYATVDAPSFGPPAIVPVSSDGPTLAAPPRQPIVVVRGDSIDASVATSTDSPKLVRRTTAVVVAVAAVVIAGGLLLRRPASPHTVATPVPAASATPAAAPLPSSPPVPVAAPISAAPSPSLSVTPSAVPPSLKKPSAPPTASLKPKPKAGHDEDI